MADYRDNPQAPKTLTAFPSNVPADAERFDGPDAYKKTDDVVPGPYFAFLTGDPTRKLDPSRSELTEAGPDVDVHPASARFYQILQSLAELHARKQSDYGKVGDPFSNVRSSEDFGVEPWVGAMIRANDKMRRIQKAAAQVVRGEKVSLANEGLEDSLQDLAVYAIIALVLLEEE